MTTTTADGTDHSWWKLGKPTWKLILVRTATAFKDDEIPNLAAVVTLRLVLAMVPSLIAAVAIAAQVISTDDIQKLVANANSVVPGSAQEFVQRSLESAIDGLNEKGVSALIISIGVGLFAASGAAAALINALNRAYGVKEGRGFVGQRTVSLGVVGALALAMVGMFLAIVLGPTILEFLLPASIIESPLNILITIGRYVAGITILMLFFGFAFWFGPNRDRPTLRFLTPGAVLGVVGWLLLSYLFGLYVRLAGNYSATYGAFAGVIVLLIWMNYSFIVLLMGAELDDQIERQLDRLDDMPDVDVPLATVVADASSGSDFDAVDPDMPRHPGLVPSEGPPAAPDPRESTGRDAVLPGRIRGAAAQTVGARLARRIWGRLGRD